jgi:hypothetical protein
MPPGIAIVADKPGAYSVVVIDGGLEVAFAAAISDGDLSDLLDILPLRLLDARPDVVSFDGNTLGLPPGEIEILHTYYRDVKDMDRNE